MVVQEYRREEITRSDVLKVVRGRGTWYTGEGLAAWMVPPLQTFSIGEKIGSCSLYV